MVLGFGVDVVDLYGQGFYFVVLTQFHLPDEVWDDQVDNRVGCDLVPVQV